MWRLKSEENVIPRGLERVRNKNFSSDNGGQNILDKILKLSGTGFHVKCFKAYLFAIFYRNC